MHTQRFCSWSFTAGLLVLLAQTAAADKIAEALKQPILKPGEASHQHTAFVTSRIPELKLPASAAEWQTESARLRQRVLDEVVFRGVPKEWYSPQPRVVWAGQIKSGKGYTIRKLRYEALPGLWIPALLYQPDELKGKVPVVLNVNGHDSKGKASPYKQIRCINQAKRGMLALNLEWLGMGQLQSGGYRHNNLGMLDLCGRSGLSVFYLAMSRGLDVLLSHPHADPQRTAVTGLSGGGWQTIILSSLDTRVKLTVPVAGYSALSQRVVHRSSIGDLEQVPSDLVSIADYAHLTALMVPRPTLLIYNAADNCCFVSKTVKPNTFEPVVPFFEQAGVPGSFEYHENTDPGTHNYELDNRQQLYRFLGKHFFAGGNTSPAEIPSADEVKPQKELDVEIPKDNATFHSLAAAAAAGLPMNQPNQSPKGQRKRLQEILRFKALTGKAEQVGKTEKHGEATVKRFRLQLGEEWVIPALVVAGNAVKRTALLLADSGYATQSKQIVELAAAGTRIVCLDPVLIGQSTPAGGPYPNAMLIATVGQRPLGVQTAQVLAAVGCFAKLLTVKKLDLIAHGPRTGMVALCAAALDGSRSVSHITTHNMPASLKEFLKPTASYSRTPEIYCFGLLQWFDVPQLRELARQTD